MLRKEIFQVGAAQLQNCPRLYTNSRVQGEVQEHYQLQYLAILAL